MALERHRDQLVLARGQLGLLLLEAPPRVAEIASLAFGPNLTATPSVVATDSLFDMIDPMGQLVSRVAWDRGGMAVGRLFDAALVEEFDQGPGVLRFTARNGIVRINRGGVLVDPSASSTILGTCTEFVRVAGASLTGNDWDIVSRPTGGIDIRRLGGNEWDLVLTLLDRNLKSAIVGGWTCSVR